MTYSPKKVIRKLLKGKALKAVESEFRIARASYANARFHWPAKDMRVIMITGTNGKTTTAHFLFSILREAGYSVGLSSTAEFRIDNTVKPNDTNMTVVNPVALRAQLAEFKAKQVDFVILEATSQALDQHRLWGIPCEVAIMTNLTQDHLDYHKTMEAYAQAKAKLWDLEPKISVLNTDDEWTEYFTPLATQSKTFLTYGSTGNVALKDYKTTKQGSVFTLELESGKSKINLTLSGKYNAYNACAAAAAAIGLGIDEERIEAGLENLRGIPGRLEPVQIDAPYTVIVDYAHTPDGLKQLLITAQEMTPKKTWLVFGACGDRDKAKRPIMGEIAAKYADHIVVTDEESYSEDPIIIQEAVISGVKKVKGTEKKLHHIPERREAIDYALKHAQAGDLVLITGLGHEQFRIENGQKTPWNDAEVVKDLATQQ